MKYLLVWLGLCLLTGCGGESAPEPVVLVDLHFSTAHRDSNPDAAAGWLSPWHRLHRGWDRPGSRGAWTLGRHADLDLFLLGEDLELTVRCRTARRLARRGQQLTVLLNGTPLDSAAVTIAREDAELTVALPDSIVVPGPNRVTLRATRYVHQGADPERALFVKYLRVTGRLSRAERERFMAPSGCGWTDTELVLETASDPTAAVPDGGAGRPQRPDLLIILLDAARADHFGCYGYPRNTTPNIDRLAADGIHFEQVFAACPYTLCSVPSLLTGRNWVEHGVCHKGGVLPPDMPVLAEILRQNGYTTLGFSENPYISRTAGSDRGFIEFHESWTDTVNTTVERVRSRIGQLPESEPVLCYIHFMPPHEPYDPSPPHDLFTDPAYSGPVNGGSDFLRAIDRGQVQYTSADLAQLIGLYDGNLHMADQWTDDVLTAWQALGRQRELLTVIVSDHGEAFAEHQRFGHNSTLYTEMLHVPLIMHPRRICKQLVPATGSLRALSDVMPMLLRMLEIPLPAKTSWPRHFLRLYRGNFSDRQLIPLRPSHKRFYGVRTPDFLAIHGGLGRQELYEVRADPDNQHDVRAEYHEEFARLISTLSNVIRAGARQHAAADTVEFSDLQKQRLEALGY